MADSNRDEVVSRIGTFLAAFFRAVFKGTPAFLLLWGLVWVVSAVAAWSGNEGVQRVHDGIAEASSGAFALSLKGYPVLMWYCIVIGMWTWAGFSESTEDQKCDSCGANYAVTSTVINRKQISRIARERSTILTDAEDRNKVIRFAEATYEDTVKTSCKACGAESISTEYETVEEDSDEATVWASHISKRMK